MHRRQLGGRRRTRLWFNHVGARAAAGRRTGRDVQVVAHADALDPDDHIRHRIRALADARRLKQAYLRFKVDGLRDRTVTGVRLQMRAREGSALVDCVFALSPGVWTEATSYQDRPHARRTR